MALGKYGWITPFDTLIQLEKILLSSKRVKVVDVAWFGWWGWFRVGLWQIMEDISFWVQLEGIKLNLNESLSNKSWMLMN